jgi:hypothetical protein
MCILFAIYFIRGFNYSLNPNRSTQCDRSLNRIVRHSVVHLPARTAPGPNLLDPDHLRPGPGPGFSGPDLEVWVRGLENSPGPDPDQTVDSVPVLGVDLVLDRIYPEAKSISSWGLTQLHYLDIYLQTLRMEG